jgi:ribosomal protein L11 methyltransferase
MGYYEFILTVPDASRDAVLNKISEMGCLGVTENSDSLVAFFRDGQDVTRLRDELNSFKRVLNASDLDDGFYFDYHYLAERDWNESWKKKFIPIDVGANLSIIPPWEKRDNGRTALVIDPGMAFGTGHHETTKTCLMLIEGLAGKVVRKRFLDVGTGTGILAIAASRLGFGEVVGVDIDPLAVDAASRNVALNALGNVLIRLGDISAVKGRFNVIAANLMSQVLTGIASEIASRLDGNGTVLLSGILIGQENDVMDAMNNAGLRIAEKVIDGRWVSLIASHRD